MVQICWTFSQHKFMMENKDSISHHPYPGYFPLKFGGGPFHCESQFSSQQVMTVSQVQENLFSSKYSLLLVLALSETS